MAYIYVYIKVFQIDPNLIIVPRRLKERPVDPSLSLNLAQRKEAERRGRSGGTGGGTRRRVRRRGQLHFYSNASKNAGHF
jgi:hypothetical protein